MTIKDCYRSQSSTFNYQNICLNRWNIFAVLVLILIPRLLHLRVCSACDVHLLHIIRELYLANYLPTHRGSQRPHCSHYPVNLLIIVYMKCIYALLIHAGRIINFIRRYYRELRTALQTAHTHSRIIYVKSIYGSLLKQ